MISEIERHAGDSAAYTNISSFSEDVLNAMRDVPRHEFVPESYRRSAYVDSPLSIGHGQTISQPFIVALMCEVLEIKKTDRLLEVGTGCGYHAAVLSKLCREVFTLEIVRELALIAAKNLAPYANVKVMQKNGYTGWIEKAPFDAISVAAAADQIPESLISQLAVDGRMIIPLKNPGEPDQSLVLIKKRNDGSIYRRDILPVIFVPFIK
jgi:protein-L-isoaspartate(D-aspartate) O-methyltransferase